MLVVFLPAYLVTRHAAANHVTNAPIWVLVTLVFPIVGFLLYLTYWQHTRREA